MKFKKILIIFLCVSLLAAFSVSCFATSQETYGFYISPGEYILNDTLDLSYTFEVFIPFSSGGFNFISFGVQASPSSLFYIRDDNVLSQIYNLNGYPDGDLYRTLVFNDGFYIYDIMVFQWWQSNVTRVSPGYNSSFFDNMLSIFTAIGQWISGAAANLTSMFFVDNSLTFVGTLCVAALSMAAVFLIIGLISRFLRFRA